MSFEPFTDKERELLKQGLADWADTTAALQRKLEKLCATRNAIIEECARVAETILGGYEPDDSIPAAIRALKDKPYE